MDQLNHTTIKVTKKGKVSFWDIVHNLPDYGLDLMVAFESWALRTKNPTIDDFCNYVKSKDVNFICMTKQQFDKIVKE